MHYTKIVTSFLKNDEKILILKRSDMVKSMKGLWAGVSGIIEQGETPLVRAKIEIFEEVGLEEKHIKLLKSSEQIKVESPQYRNHQWEIFPFLFETKNTKIKLNWENSDFKWINVDQIKEFETVPNLEEILLNLI